MRTNSTFYLKGVMIALLHFITTSVFGEIQIHNENELKAIRNDLSGSYILMNDITLTEDWIPVGDEENRFSGTIDGNHKSIYGLKFRNAARDGAGFIGIADGATIKNLSLIGAQIYGGQDVGGIVGRAYAPTYVEKCYTSGAFSGYDHIGGIIGGSRSSSSSLDYSTITDCYSTAVVVSTSWQAGGIIGTSVDIDVINTYFAGVAVCSQGRTGGIVALADGGHTNIRNSVVVAPCLKGDETNRIMGGENGKSVSLENNYSWEDTEVYRKGTLYTGGESNADGLDGEHSSETKLKSHAFYTTELVWSAATWKIEDGKYPLFLHQSYPLAADGIYVPLFPERAIPGRTFDAQAISALNRTITYQSSNNAVAAIDANGLVTFIGNGVATLTFSTQGNATYGGATVTLNLTVEGINYQLSNEEDLRNIKYDLAGTFTLANNITLTKDWVFPGTFTGALNGNGHIIYGLKFEDKNKKAVGLFNYAEGAVITQLGIEKAHFVGNEDVGAIVGEARGCIIRECYVADSYIEGRDHAGSLVGAMRSYDRVVVPGDPDNNIDEEREKTYTTISNCYSGAQIYSREFQAGGIAGIINGGVIENCYFSGLIQSMDGRAAGIVSLLDSDDDSYVKNNINLAAAVYCTESYRIGDYGERLDYAKFTNNWSKEQSYFGIDLKNSAIKTNYVTNDKDGSNLSNDSLALSSNFYITTLGWDFSNIWKFIPNAEGKMYPVLKWQQTPVVSKIHGIPTPAYLTWYPGSDENIDLRKIIATYGQALNLVITEGAQYVEKDGNLLYITESTLTQDGVTEVRIDMDNALNSIINLQNATFDIAIYVSGTVYDINSVADLLAVNEQPFSHFRLTRNIDMTGVSFNGIGSAQSPFTGIFDGNGYAIINPVVTTADENKRGLFNATNNNAVIKNLGVVNFSFSGSKNNGSGSADLGGLVGSCKKTTIDQCYITGNILGRDHVGAFVGGDCEDVAITNSFARATINSYWQAGGFFGVTSGDKIVVRNCYFAGSIATQDGWAGGIIGLIDRDGDIKISNTVSIGDVSSGGKAGYHIGGNNRPDGATVSLFLNNLYNTNAYIRTNGEEWILPAEIPNQTVAALAKTPAQLKQETTYTTLGWDFNTIWAIEEGADYPTLKNVRYISTGIPSIVHNPVNYSAYMRDNNIYVSGIEQSAEITVYNVHGQIIVQSIVDDKGKIPVSMKGFYILRITENGKTASLKVMVK
jgi:hypothetical protein